MIEIIKEIIKNLREDIAYIKVGDSRALPFIRNYHDFDIFIVCNNESDRLNCLQYINENFNRKELREKYQLDSHVLTAERDTNYLTNLADTFYFDVNHVLIDEFSESIPVKTITIDEYLEKEDLIKQNATKALKFMLEKNLNVYLQKRFYYIYTDLCVLKNKSFDFTEEQIDNINMLHDREEKDIEKRTKLIDEIIKEIESWQI